MKRFMTNEVFFGAWVGASCYTLVALMFMPTALVLVKFLICMTLALYNGFAIGAKNLPPV